MRHRIDTDFGQLVDPYQVKRPWDKSICEWMAFARPPAPHGAPSSFGIVMVDADIAPEPVNTYGHHPDVAEVGVECR